MYKSQYLNDLMDIVNLKYGHEKEFIASIQEFFDSMEFLLPYKKCIETNAILERLIVPERVISFRICWLDDSGKIQVNNGWRVQFNSAIGPYKGGIRFAKNVDLSIMKFLGFEQTFKNALTGLPMGGGKGGSDFDPIGKSDNEIMRFCQAFMTELYRHIGPNTDVPAGDFGVGAREIGYMYGMYRKLTNTWTGTFTGKGLSYGGSLARPEATGFGILYFAQEMLAKFKNTTIKDKKVIISGSGKVGSFAAMKAKQLGAVIVGMSDREGFVYDENGLDVDFILELAKQNGLFKTEYLKAYPNVKNSSNPRDIWNNHCDIAIPCATQGEIFLENAKQLKENGCYMLVEGANMPCDVEAIRYFNKNGVIFSPGKASNAGGVAVSGLEMTQNAEHISWTFEEVDNKLKDIMKTIFNTCYDTAKKYGDEKNLAMGANIAGFLKVYDAMMAQGVI